MRLFAGAQLFRVVPFRPLMLSAVVEERVRVRVKERAGATTTTLLSLLAAVVVVAPFLAKARDTSILTVEKYMFEISR